MDNVLVIRTRQKGGEGDIRNRSVIQSPHVPRSRSHSDAPLLHEQDTLDRVKVLKDLNQSCPPSQLCVHYDLETIQAINSGFLGVCFAFPPPKGSHDVKRTPSAEPAEVSDDPLRCRAVASVDHPASFSSAVLRLSSTNGEACACGPLITRE